MAVHFLFLYPYDQAVGIPAGYFAKYEHVSTLVHLIRSSQAVERQRRDMYKSFQYGVLILRRIQEEEK